jgi:hypothetical protein
MKDIIAQLEPIRYPRPLGATLASKAYQTQSTTDNYDILVSSILTSFISNNFTLNQKQYNVQEIATYLNIPQEQVLKKINTITSTLSNMLTKDNLEETSRVIFQQVLNWALNDKAHIHTQYSLLALSQGTRYKPFISSEVNHILTSSLKATQNLMSLLSQIQGNKGLQININNTNQTTENVNFISIQKATEMLAISDAKSPALPAHEKYADLYEINGLNEVEEVVANAAEETALIKVGAMVPQGDKALEPTNKKLKEEERGLEDNDMPNRE